MTSLLAVQNISKSFGGLKAVADVSLAVTPGEICSVIGPNGAGKTTLFNMISGVLRPSSGRIMFEGTDLADVSPWRFAAKGIGRTFQNLALFKHGTVVENILTGRHTHLRSSVLDAVLFFGRTRREEIVARQRVEEIIEFLEIEHIRDAIVGTLSYGQQKRVELARALACEPKLLLLDEMVSGMNQEETEDIARFVLDIRDELGITVLMIEHEMRIVMDISDRVHVLNFGRKIAEGAWAVYASRSYVERHGRPDGPEDIAHHCVVQFDGTIANHAAAEWLRMVAPHATIGARSESFPGLVLAVKSGAGLAPLPTVLADGESELVRVIDSVPELVTHYYLLMHPDMQHTPRVRAFYDFVESEIKLFRGALVG